MNQPVVRELEPLLNSHDVARILGVSRSAAYRMMRDGVIPTVKFGPHCVRVRRIDLEQEIERKLINKS